LGVLGAAAVNRYSLVRDADDIDETVTVQISAEQRIVVREGYHAHRGDPSRAPGQDLAGRPRAGDYPPSLPDTTPEPGTSHAGSKPTRARRNDTAKTTGVFTVKESEAYSSDTIPASK
jgi:hypothetical protein